MAGRTSRAVWGRMLSGSAEALYGLLRLPTFWALIFVMTPTAFVYCRLVDRWLGGATNVAAHRAVLTQPGRLLIWLSTLFLSMLTLCLCAFSLDLLLWFGVWASRAVGVPALLGIAPAAMYAAVVLYVYVAVYKGRI
jgi:hypothetical protein